MKRARVGGFVLMVGFLATPRLDPGGLRMIAITKAADYDSLMRDAIARRRAGDDASALKLFQQAYELEQTPRALAQVGLAEQALGQWGHADKHLRRALESGDDPWIRKNHGAIDSALLVVASHVGQLEVSGTPGGAEVRVDGELVGQLPLSEHIAVKAGGVAIEVTAPGCVPIVRAATITAGTLTREIFNLQSLAPRTQGAAATAGDAGSFPPQTAHAGPVDASTLGGTAPGGANATTGPGAAPGGPGEPARARSSRFPLVLVMSGLSAASLAFGIFEHLSWQDKASSFSSNMGCGTSFPDRGAPGCKALYDDGRRGEVLAFVGYGLTVAFAATAVVLAVTAPGSDPEPQRVACAPNPWHLGLGCRVTF